MDAPWVGRYHAAWEKFVSELAEIHIQAGEQTSGQEPAPRHAALRRAYDVPYQQLIKLSRAASWDNSATRVGSTCGFFFESLVATVVSGTLRGQCKEVHVARNGYLSAAPAGCPKEPDIYLEHCQRRIVFEVKAQVFSKTLDALEAVRQRYKSCAVDYYLVAGWTSASRSSLEQYSSQARWMTVLAGGEDAANCLARFPSFDDILEDAARCGGRDSQ